MSYQVIFTDELYHHGIKGQRWGVRRYRNEDGSLTEAGKRRYYKEIKKEYNKQRNPQMPLLINKNLKDSIKNKTIDTKVLESKRIKEDLKELSDLKKEFIETSSKTVEFFDSKACKEATKLAYKKTYEWFEENDPNYLKEIIKNNNGKKDNLDERFHDFRKAFEGYEDIEWEKAEIEWKKTPEGKASKLADKVWDNYSKKLNDVGNNITTELLGNYGKKKLGTFGDETYNDLISSEVEYLLIEMENNRRS